MLSAPILSTTIDQLIKSVGVAKGNSDLIPTLSLIKSDLILDEVDNYSTDDIKIIAKLIELTASYGNKVLISSATITPYLSEVLYDAYRRGYETYCFFKYGYQKSITTVWIDEFSIKIANDFKANNTRFYNKRLSNIEKRGSNKVGLVLPDVDNRDELFEQIYSKLF